MIGFWPAILAMSATAFSSIFLLAAASPTPMFSVILVMRGTCISVLVAELLRELGDDLVFVEFFKARHDRVPYAST